MISDKEARQYILQQLYDAGYRYLARDENTFLYAYKQRPAKQQNMWSDTNYISSCVLLYSFLCFKDIKWADDSPLSIAKELGIIDWTKVPKDTKVLVWDGEGTVKKIKDIFHIMRHPALIFLLEFIVMGLHHGLIQTRPLVINVVSSLMMTKRGRNKTMTKCTPEEIQELIGLYEDALADDLNYYEDKCETPIELSANMMEAIQDCMEELEDKLITLLFEGRRAYKKKFGKEKVT